MTSTTINQTTSAHARPTNSTSAPTTNSAAAPMTLPTLGVVIVSFNSGDVIFDCLEILLSCTGVRLAIVIVDNASTDDTPDQIRDWAAGREAYVLPDDLPFALTPTEKPLPLLGATDSGLPQGEAGHTVTLLETGVNSGFAGGVNHGLAHLARDPLVDRFWVLNPDGLPAPDTPRLFATALGPDGTDRFALMAGRILYLDGDNNKIQSDGGILRRTGVSVSRNMFARHPATAAPDPATLDYLSGASLVASRAFYEAAGPMPEDYFLYYEEVEWAQRRGDLPLVWATGAITWHRAGTSIGSGRPDRAPSDFSTYFLHRARLRFVRRFRPLALPLALAQSVYKASSYARHGYWSAARTVMVASLGLPAPAGVRARLSPEAQKLAFGR